MTSASHPANTHDPVVQWAHLMGGLSPKSWGAVAETLRHHAAHGGVDTAETVGLLVAYAAGRIDARAYASGSLRLLQLEHRDTWVNQGDPFRVDPPAQQRVTSVPREHAVQAYVDGRIPLEEFLKVIIARQI